MDIKIRPFKVSGELTAPPSKSFAHRYIIAGFLSGKKCVIKNAGNSDDVLHTIFAVRSLGAVIEKNDDIIEIKGRKSVDTAVVDCGESGSTLRFLIPVASALGINAEFTGKGKLLSRPIDDLAEVLAQGGVRLSGHKVCGKLKSGIYSVNAGVSSQFITGMLLALSYLKGESKLILRGNIVSAGYIDMTIEVLKNFGIKIIRTGNEFLIHGGYKNAESPAVLEVEGDWSGAAFPLCMAAINGEVVIKGLKYPSFQKDCEILNILKKFGAAVSVEETNNGQAIALSCGKLKAITENFENMPDIAQVAAAVAAYADGVSVFYGIERLRFKESDRINAIIDTLKVAGIKAELIDGALKIYGGRPRGGDFDGGKDHRTVMSAVTIAVNADGNSVIFGAEYYAKSYPEFIEHVKKIGGSVDVVI